MDSPCGLLGLPHSMVARSQGEHSRVSLKLHHLFGLVLRVTQHDHLYILCFIALVRNESLSPICGQRREIKLNILTRVEVRL